MESDKHKDSSKLGKRSPRSVNFPAAKEQKTDSYYPERGSEEWENPTKEQCILWLKNLVSSLIAGKEKRTPIILQNLENTLELVLGSDIPISPLNWKPMDFAMLHDCIPSKYISTNLVANNIRAPQEIEVKTEDILEFSDGDTGFINFMHGQIQKCLNLYQTFSIFAPYFTLVQSSGSGKTRTLKELCEIYPSVYIDLKNSHTNTRTQEFLNNIRHVCEIEDPEEATNNTKDILSSLQKDAIKSRENPKKSEITLIVIDEASKLLEYTAKYKTDDESPRNSFILLRKALSRLKDANMVMIVADTTSRLNNFSPSIKSFVSHMRVEDMTGKELYPPIWNLPYDDIGKDDKNIIKILDNSKTRNDETNIKNFRTFIYQIKLGRPLWVSTYVTCLKNPIPEKNQYIQFWALVGYKLFGTEYLQKKEDFDTIPIHRSLPILGARLTLNIISTKVAEDLVSKSLATITGISFDRETVFCSYKSEPVVAEMAAFLMNNNLGGCLSVLWKSFVQSHIDSGSIGEIIAELILLRGFDLCIPEKDRLEYFQNLEKYPIRLEQFLKQFLSEEYFTLSFFFEGEKKTVMEYINSIPNLDDTGVFFSHFASWSEELSLDLFNRALERGCAIHCKKINFPGIDLVIPTYSISENKLNGCIWIQVKNQQDDRHWRENSGERMSPQSFLTPEVYQELQTLPVSFGIYMGLRQQLPSKKTFSPIFRFHSSTKIILSDVQSNLHSYLENLKLTKASKLTEIFEQRKLQEIASVLTNNSKVKRNAVQIITKTFLTSQADFWTIYTSGGNHSGLALDDFTKSFLVKFASRLGLNVEKSSTKKAIIKLFYPQPDYTNLIVFQSHFNLQSLFGEEQNYINKMLSLNYANQPHSQLSDRKESFTRFKWLNQQALQAIPQKFQ